MSTHKHGLNEGPEKINRGPDEWKRAAVVGRRQDSDQSSLHPQMLNTGPISIKLHLYQDKETRQETVAQYSLGLSPVYDGCWKCRVEKEKKKIKGYVWF